MRRKFSLSDAVEALTAEGYVVLTAEQGEDATALLGEVAFRDGGPIELSVWASFHRQGLAQRAEEILAAWPGAVPR